MNTLGEGLPAATNVTRFLFWNIGRRPLLSLVASLVHERDVDILILAESDLADDQLRGALRRPSGPDYLPVRGVSTRLTFYSRFLPRFIEPLEDYAGLSIRHLKPPVGKDVLLVAVHLASKLYLSDGDQAMSCPRFAERIRKAESAVGHARTVVVGDFNMNPFELGVVAADGFHAVMDSRIAARGSRQVHGETRQYFYNPMWHLFKDSPSAPLGTYYYDRSGRQKNYYWNTFDQVLIRPDLLDSFHLDRLSVVTKVGETALVSDYGRPDPTVGSDHLPLVFDLTL